MEGSLHKVSEHAHNLHERYFRVHEGRTLRYWANARDAQQGVTPRGEGWITSAEEWWPKAGKLVSGNAAPPRTAPPPSFGWKAFAEKAEQGVRGSLSALGTVKSDVFALSAKLQPGITHATELWNDSAYDGRTFCVHLNLAAGGRATFYLVATTREEKRRWLSALAAHAQPGASSPASERSETATGGGGASAPAAVASLFDDEAVGSSAEDDAAGESAAAGTEAAEEETFEAAELRRVLDALPEVWAMWSERGELAVASERYAALLRKAPACWQLLQDRGNFFLFQDELRRAEADFTSALDLQSSRAELWNDRAACRIQSGQHESARADLEAALRLNPNFAEALSNLGNVHRTLGELGRAKEAYNAALLLNPRDARTWNNRGALQEELGNLVAAELDVNRAVELGGCDKAVENRARIGQLLALGETELRLLTPCSMVEGRAGSVLWYVFEEGPLGLFLVNTAGKAAGVAASSSSTGEAAGWSGSSEEAAGSPGEPAGVAEVAEPAEVVDAGGGAGGGARACVASDSSPLGAAAPGEVVIAAVYQDSQAASHGVPVGGIIVGLNGSSVGKLPHAELTRRIGEAPRPLSLQVRCPPLRLQEAGAAAARTQPAAVYEGARAVSAQRDPTVHGFSVPPGGLSDLGEAPFDEH